MRNKKQTPYLIAALCSLAIVLLAGLGLSACSKSRMSDSEVLSRAVRKMQSGELIRAVESALEFASLGAKGPTTRPTNGAPESAENSSVSPALSPALTPALPIEPPAGVACVAASPIRDGAPEEELIQALREFAACARDELRGAKLLDQAIQYFRVFNSPADQPALSSRSEAELEAFFLARRAEQRLGDRFESVTAKPGSLRASYSNHELDELTLLTERRRSALFDAESRIFAEVAKRQELLRHFAETIDRYEVLLALAEHANVADPNGRAVVEKIVPILKRSGVKVPKLVESSYYPIYPYAILAVVPDPGRELLQLNRLDENPLERARLANMELGGRAADVSFSRSLYSIWRDKDNPEPPGHPVAHPDAARVAFIDTGIDYLTFPELGYFLGIGKGRSRDFADGDLNPWLPSFREDFLHGSGTLATLLTIISHHAPALLTERKLETDIWKVQSLRQLLSGEAHDVPLWESRYGVQDAVFSSADLAEKGSSSVPKIVSVSVSFDLRRFAERLGRHNVLMKAPWLWVMAAGNAGLDVRNARVPACLSDMPAEWRNANRILCVGALLRGIIDDKIASYSSYGDFVDVFAYESYSGLCPNGTSCATPSISAAAAIIAASFPALSAEQIRRVIIDSSDTRTLQVDFKKIKVERTVRVFDTPTMIGRALQNAAKLASAIALGRADGRP